MADSPRFDMPGRPNPAGGIKKGETVSYPVGHGPALTLPTLITIGHLTASSPALPDHMALSFTYEVDGKKECTPWFALTREHTIKLGEAIKRWLTPPASN